MSELRWNPLLGEWTVTATHRQDRTFFPPPGYCPLCPTAPGGFPTEVPEPTYDIVVFENKFPSLHLNPPAPAVEASELYPVRPAQGVWRGCRLYASTQFESGAAAGVTDL